MDIFNGLFTNKFSERQPEMSASLQTRITLSTFKQIMLAAWLMLVSSAAFAQLGGHTVVLVHGLEKTHFSKELTPQQLLEGSQNYWRNSFEPYADYRIDWDSKQRIAEVGNTVAKEVIIQMAQDNACENGCIFVTHSTGDLLTRYIFDNMDTWIQAVEEEEGVELPDFNVLVSLDFAGAGGGSELADIAFDSVDYITSNKLLSAIFGFTGGSQISTENLGAMLDLRVTVARKLATTPNAIPRLRFVGAGSDTFITIAKLALPGSDDSVVALHSACGAVNADGIDSCSNTVQIDGLRDSANGPDKLMVNHYPMLQASKISHRGTIEMPAVNGDDSSSTDDKMSYIYYNGFSAKGQVYNLGTYVKIVYPWLSEPEYYQRMDDISAEKSMSQIVIDSLSH